MDMLGNLSRIYKSAIRIPIDNSSKIVIMSDIHRGDGSWADDFSKNQNLYFTALNYYYDEGYTYLENGDGDELWKFDKLTEVIEQHKDAFWILSELYADGRLYFIYGNHDMVKRDPKYVEKYLYQYYNHREKRAIPLFEHIQVHEGIVLRHLETEGDIFVVHGHQVDPLSSTFWRVARFLVRYLWRPLESFGAHDPTDTAKNYTKKERVENKLTEWVKGKECMIFTGHTHRPMLPELGEPLYFNHGSCVHPRCITAIEIDKGEILLVKWTTKVKKDGILYITREILVGPKKIEDYFGHRG